jgi:hypothetical protein
MENGLLKIWNAWDQFTEKIYDSLTELVDNSPKTDDSLDLTHPTISSNEDPLIETVIQRNLADFKLLSNEMKKSGLKPNDALKCLDIIVITNQEEFLLTFEQLWWQIWDKSWDTHLLKESILNMNSKENEKELKSLNKSPKKTLNKTMAHHFLKKGVDPTSNQTHETLKILEQNLKEDPLKKQWLQKLKFCLEIYPHNELKIISSSNQWSELIRKQAQKTLKRELYKYAPNQMINLS